MNTFNSQDPIFKILLLGMLLLSSPKITMGQISMEYASHHFDACENLILTINYNLIQAVCGNDPVTGLGPCHYTVEGYILIKSGSSSLINPVYFYQDELLGYNQSGTLHTYDIIIPPTDLVNLNPGSQYDLVFELNGAYIAMQAGSQLPNYGVFSPCWEGTMTLGDAESFTGPSCEKVMATFTYAPTIAEYSWQQGEGILCSKKPYFHCWTVNTLEGIFQGPSVGFSGATYEWYVDGVSVGTSQNLNYIFPNCGTYRVELHITDPSNCTSPYVYAQDIEIVNSPQCYYEPDFPPNPNRIGILGLDEIEIHISPNPVVSNQSVLIEYFTVAENSTTFMLFDINGKKVLTESTFSKGKGVQTHKMKLPNLSPGLYLLKVDAGNASGEAKIIISQ